MLMTAMEHSFVTEDEADETVRKQLQITHEIQRYYMCRMYWKEPAGISKDSAR